MQRLLLLLLDNPLLFLLVVHLYIGTLVTAYIVVAHFWHYWKEENTDHSLARVLKEWYQDYWYIHLTAFLSLSFSVIASILLDIKPAVFTTAAVVWVAYAIWTGRPGRGLKQVTSKEVHSYLRLTVLDAALLILALLTLRLTLLGVLKADSEMLDSAFYWALGGIALGWMTKIVARASS